MPPIFHEPRPFCFLSHSVLLSFIETPINQIYNTRKLSQSRNLIMGNGASNPVAQMAAKNKAGEIGTQAKEGFNTLTGGKSEAEKERDLRNKDRAAEYELKKKEREERKKKLSSQWAANKKANT